MRTTLFITACLLTTALAGCAVNTPGATNESFTLSRQIRVHVDSSNVESESDNPYDYIDAAFVVRINGDAVAPAAVTIVYQDESGATVSKPLSAFTTLTELTKGMEVRVGDANITSDAVLLLAGVEVASRARPHTEWWNVGGYPIGVRMEPGSALAYRTTMAASESFSIVDVRGNTPETDDLVLDKASASFGVKYDGTIDLSLASAPSSVVAEKEHSAFPLDWKATGKVTTPFTAEASGRNLTSGESITAGFALTPTSGGEFDANGRLWWNVSGSPVRADLSGGSWKARADATAWLTGIPEMEGSFSCAGKAKADNCKPTELPEMFTSGNGTFEADSANLDGFPWDVDPEVQANLTRFLDEDLVPGDELRFDVDIDTRKMKEPDLEEDGPQWIAVSGGAVLKAVDYESVSVAAGRFDALKLIERVEMRIDLGPVAGEDGTVLFKSFVLEERFVDTTFWLEKTTFVPLRIEQTIPLDLDRIVNTALDNLDASVWEDSPIAPLTGRNLDAKVEGTSSLELTRHAAGARFSPYVVIAGFHGIAAIPAIAYLSSMGGLDDDEMVGTMPYPHDMSQSGDETSYYGYNATPPEPIVLTLEDHGPVAGDVKEYVAMVYGDATYGRLAFTLNDESLVYGEESGSWCLVDASTGACAGLFQAYLAPIASGDVLRFRSTDIQGAAMTVYDADTGEVILTLTVS